MAYLPLPIIRMLGAGFGRAGIKFSKRAYKRLKDNLLKTKMCSGDKVEQMALESARNLGMTLLETIMLAWNCPKKHNYKLVHTNIGFDLVEKANKDGLPILFLTPHIGNFEVTLKRVAYLLKRKFTVLYKPDKKLWWNKLMVRGRTEDNITPVPTTKKGVLAIFKALKNNEIAGVLPDSVASHGDGVWVKFFDVPVFATTLAAKLTLMPNVQTFIVATKRDKDGFSANYIPFTPSSEDITTTVQEIYRVIEDSVLENKEQFYWSYNRFRVPDHAKPIEQEALNTGIEL